MALTAVTRLRPRPGGGAWRGGGWRGRLSLAALGGYAVVSFLYLGLRLLIEPGGRYLGFSSDPKAFIWCFAWWPHAILAGENPFVTHAIWAPGGVNLIWTTSVPGLALLFSPLTLLAGAVVSYNTCTVLLPAFAAWTAFLLCRRLTRGAVWPSLVGGYLFGFSSYVLGQEEGHPHMTAVFLVPLVALVLVRFVEGELDGRGVVVRLGPLLALEFLFSTEVVFTLGLAVVVALVLGYAAFPARRRRIAALVRPLAVSCVLAIVLTAPFVYYAVTGFQSAEFHPPTAFITDLLNFAVPTKLAAASLGWANGIARHFPGNDSERDGYLGLPVLAICAAFAWRRIRTPSGRFLVAALAIGVVATLGGKLTVDGHATVWLPWSVVESWPLFDNVLPERLAMYVSLVTAIIVALWAASRRHGALRFVLPALAVLALVPNPAAGVWASGYTVPAFFTDSAYASCVTPGEIVLPLPVSAGSESMLWQTVAGFRFRMAGGNIAPNPPAAFSRPAPIALVADGQPLTAADVSALKTYVYTYDVTEIVVDESQLGQWSGALDQIATPHVLGGVVVYALVPLPSSCLAAAS